ncbi:MAG: ATP-binding cassette domain-containing protein [Candidatus Aenigmarchaeota archaeon]|nr:ATP-binding cassette domain-containing protein [Candidatus Aenigmarchaeota archaeon]
MLLEVKDLKVYYDTALVLNEVSLEVEAGTFIGVVGPNGAGKSTLLRTISGLVKWQKDMLKGTKFEITIEGTVKFDGKRIDTLLPHEIVEKGLIHCPERRRPFREMTVKENLEAGAYLFKDQMNNNLEMVYELFPVLKERTNQISGTLSGGEQQMLAIGRALMSQPKLLCIDEPSTGLAPMLKKTVFERIRDIQKKGVTILLAEQDVSSTFSLAHRNYVLSAGKVVAEGTKEDLLKDESIRKAYLGI